MYIVISPIFKYPFLILRAVWRALKKIGIVPDNNPTRDWAKDLPRELIVDLDKATLCGIGLGEPVDKLAFFGPCEDYNFGSMHVMCVDRDGIEITDGTDIDAGPVYHHTLGYDSMGIAVFSNPERMLEFFSVTFIPDSDEPFTKPYSGIFQYGGCNLKVADLSDAAGVRKTLGEPSREFDLAAAGWTASDENPYGNPSSREMTYVGKCSVCLISFNEDDRTTNLLLMPKTRSESCSAN